MLLNRVKLNPPASPEALRAFVEESGLELPADYLAFLARANGGEGSVGTVYVNFWPVEDLLPSNREYEASGFAPGFFFFGADGDGEGFAFDLRIKRPVICRLPFVGMEPGSATPMGVTFHQFLESLVSEPESDL